MAAISLLERRVSCSRSTRTGVTPVRSAADLRVVNVKCHRHGCPIERSACRSSWRCCSPTWGSRSRIPDRMSRTTTPTRKPTSRPAIIVRTFQHAFARSKTSARTASISSLVQHRASLQQPRTAHAIRCPSGPRRRAEHRPRHGLHGGVHAAPRTLRPPSTNATATAHRRVDQSPSAARRRGRRSLKFIHTVSQTH